LQYPFQPLAANLERLRSEEFTFINVALLPLTCYQR